MSIEVCVAQGIHAKDIILWEILAVQIFQRWRSPALKIRDEQLPQVSGLMLLSPF